MSSSSFDCLYEYSATKFPHESQRCSIVVVSAMPSVALKTICRSISCNATFV